MSVQKFFGKSSRAVLKEVRSVLGDDAVIISNRTNGSGVEVLAMAGNAIDDLVESVDTQAERRTLDRPQMSSEPSQPESFENYLRRAKRTADKPVPTINSTTNSGYNHLRAPIARAAAEYESVFSAQMDNPAPSPFDTSVQYADAWAANRHGSAKPPLDKRTSTPSVSSVMGPSPRQVPVERASVAGALCGEVDTALEMVTGQTNLRSPDLMAEIRSMKGLLQDQLSQIAWSDNTRRSPRS